MRFITVKWLRKRGACYDGIKIFMHEFGERASVKQVIDKLRQIEKPDWEGWLIGQGLKMAKIMLENGANIHAGNYYALRWSAENGRLEVLKFLVENGANIHANNDYALRWAARNGHLKVVEFLVENGANIHAENDCAVQWAVMDGFFKVVEFLEKAAKKINHKVKLL